MISATRSALRHAIELQRMLGMRRRAKFISGVAKVRPSHLASFSETSLPKYPLI
jgi:hypothetical protein